MRTITKTLTKVTVAGVAGVAIAATLTGPALADPPTGVVPKANSAVGVGSDTTQNVLNQLAKDYDSKSPGTPLYSFDATGSATVVTKANCAAITRPNGSGAGITALKGNARPKGSTTSYCIDFARSSRAPQAGDTSAIAFVQYAQDAVTWSYASASSAPTHAPSALTIQQLQAIYSCNAALLGTGKTGPVTWNEVGGTSTNQVVPVIPQSSSGTRSFFLKAINVTTLGSCVKGQDNSVEENEGTNAIFSSKSGPDIVFPYSIAVYLAQTQNGHGAGQQGRLKLGNGKTSTGTVIPALNGPSGAHQLNPALAQVGLTRFVYNVVRNVGTVHVPTYLQALFGKNSYSGWLCTNATAQADIRSYGFRTISSCGTVTVPTS